MSYSIDVDLSLVLTLLLLAFAICFSRGAASTSVEAVRRVGKRVQLSLRRLTGDDLPPAAQDAARLYELVEQSQYTLPKDTWAAHPVVQTTLLYSKLHKIRSQPRAKAALPGSADDSSMPATTAAIIATREMLSCPDGGSIAIDWLALTSHVAPRCADAPVIIAFPGVGACESHSGFAPMLLGALLEHGDAAGCAPFVGSVVYPGFNGLHLDSHKLPGTAYLSTGDAGVVIRHVRALHPRSPLVLIGCSFGSAMVANWCSRNAREAADLEIGAILLYAYGHSAGTTVAVADAAYAGLTGRFVAGKWRAQILEGGRSGHGRANVAFLRELERKRPAFRLDALAKATSVGEWDTACLPAYGFTSLAEMLDLADPVHTFHNLATVCPIVLFNADDDWLCPSARIAAGQRTLYSRMPNVVVVETKGGGHLGWVDQIGDEAGGAGRKGQPDEGRPQVSSPLAPRRTTGKHASWIVSLTAQLVGATAAGKLQRAAQKGATAWDAQTTDVGARATAERSRRCSPSMCSPSVRVLSQ